MSQLNHKKELKDNIWVVSITQGNASMEFTFPDEAEADRFIDDAITTSVDPQIYADIPHFDGVSGKWEMKIFIGDYPEYKLKVFDTHDEAKEYRSKCKKLKKNQSEKVTKEIGDELTFLEKLDNEMGNTPVHMDQDVPEDLEALQQKLEEFKDDYHQKKNDAECKANEILTKAAEFYLGADLISKNEYAVFKVQIHQMNLGSLLFQLEIAQKNIYTLSEQIHSSSNQPFARMFEVLGQLQRVVLDINKFIFEYMENMEKSLVNIREEINERSGTPLEEQGGERLVFYRNSKKLISDIKNFQSELDTFKEQSAKPSANSKIREMHKEKDPDPEDMKRYDDEDDDLEYDNDDTGLDSFE